MYPVFAKSVSISPATEASNPEKTIRQGRFGSQGCTGRAAIGAAQWFGHKPMRGFFISFYPPDRSEAARAAISKPRMLRQQFDKFLRDASGRREADRDFRGWNVSHYVHLKIN
jgi:hypothetical protein